MTEKQQKQLIFLYLAIHCFLSLFLALPAEAFKLEPWHIIQTQFTTIRYKSHEDLIKFHDKIKFGPGEWNVSPTLSPLTETEIKHMVAQKVDAIFTKACDILDMKKRFQNVNIFLHPDTDSLKRTYKSIYPGECRLRAWYRFKNNSAYFNVQDIHAGMLAHELAHAIIDHFLTVRPPRQTAEILARYVDTHLDRGFVN